MGAAEELKGLESSDVGPGQRLAGRYLCEKRIGEGGMGIVVRAEDTLLGRRVALKIMRPELAEDEVCRARLLREARTVAQLESEHIARVLDTGTLEGGLPFIVFEYLEGSDLCTVLAERGPLPVTLAVDYVLEACEALAEAHAHHLVHRDLKPENLFCARGVDDSVTIKVLDFGISKAIGTAAPHLALTAPQGVLGSPNYMAPEQIRAHPVDGRTDIWALGAILYELVTGRLAYDGINVTQICANILSSTSPPLASVCRPDIPASLDATIARCLSREPDDRFATVAELAESLRAFASRRTVRTIDSILNRGSEPGKPARPISGIAVRRPPVDAVTLPSALKRSTRLARALLAVAAAAVALVAIATVILRSAPVEPPDLSEQAPIVERTAIDPRPESSPVRVTEPVAATARAVQREVNDALTFAARPPTAPSPERRKVPRKARTQPVVPAASSPPATASGADSDSSGVDAWNPSNFGGRF